MTGSRRQADLEAENAELKAENAALRELIEELERRLGQSSRNSSKPPSSDSPMSRQQRRALAREKAKESLRKAGGQPGHKGSHRQMAPPERVDEAFEHPPERCSGCGHGFEGSEQRIGDPVAHQKWELPPSRPLVHEHRLLRLRCPGCGKATLAGLPKGVSASAFGPRLEAHIATLAGVFRLSRRQVAQATGEMLGIPISVGAVDATVMRMSAALAGPWQVLREAVREAEVVHADETAGGWPAPSSGCGWGQAHSPPATGSTPPAARRRPRSSWGRTSAASSSPAATPATTSSTSSNSSCAGRMSSGTCKRSPSAPAPPASSGKSSWRQRAR